MSKQAGKIVEGHELTKQIGYDAAGGFGLGHLWRARDPTGRLVALKMASPHALPLVRIKERNQHPNLVQLFGYWVFEESQYGLAIATDLHTRTPMRHRLEQAQAEGRVGIPQDKRGFVLPEDFLKLFGHLRIAEVVYKGEFGRQFVGDVRDGKYPVDEGVVAKGVRLGKSKNPQHGLWMVKVKTRRWLEDLKRRAAESEQFQQALQENLDEQGLL